MIQLQQLIAKLTSALAPYKPTVSPANRRADRIYMKRRAMSAANVPDDAGRYTRQQARRDARRDAKEMRGLRKAQAMQMRSPGGAAAVR